MMITETRWLSAAIVLFSMVGALVAGQTFGYGTVLALIGALLAIGSVIWSIADKRVR